MRLLLLPLVLSAGCISRVHLDDDADADGLPDGGEVALGSDRANPDSDGDGFLDGAEADVSANPIDPADHPFEAGWQMDACRNDLTPEGWSVGDVSNDFGLLDQFGETVRLHDFCDQAVFLVFAAFW